MSVDPCVGNDTPRALPFWHEQSFPWLDRFVEAAGFSVDMIDEVAHGDTWHFVPVPGEAV